ncbi:DUF4261 domain-containing protein [Pseudomonas sp. OV226]|uniref:DUF4261 domain-containing protein n=1 Tax=Pseudomonas sp. OV226 TaxID=2135588 RepID=UPI000D6D85F9|nr:DUF4261 domain-containing protein [Pseudomonas sp. OV226]PWK27721.1 uncharacterized protein DUF4261 [Pseudomonas sp. OV226]
MPFSFISKFFGRKTDQAYAALVAEPSISPRLSLAIVFSGPLLIDVASLTTALQAYHPTMRGARVETDPEITQIVGLAGWNDHVVQIIGFDAPYPPDALEACVTPAHYGQDIKESARVTRSFAILYYAGRTTDPFDRYVALAAVAGAMAEQHGVAVLNEHARTSLPAGVFHAAELGADSLEVLREMPLNVFFCGFVKLEVEGEKGIWMRTYGADAFDLPDFAALAEGHDEGSWYSEIFNDVMSYMLENRTQLHAGETMQIDDDVFIRLRDAHEKELWLLDQAPVLVIELISEAEINR